MWWGAAHWSANIQHKKKKLSDRGDETRNDLALTFNNSSECVYLCVCVLNKCLIGLHVLELEPLTWTLCPVVSRLQVCFLFHNEENRWERGLLVLICPGGSLGITINSQLRPHSLSPHRHRQFVPIRECSFTVSDVRGWWGRTAEQSLQGLLRAWPLALFPNLQNTQLWETVFLTPFFYVLFLHWIIYLKLCLGQQRNSNVFRSSPRPASVFLYIPIFSEGWTALNFLHFN